MWPFKKNDKNSIEIKQSDHQWIVKEGSIESGPLFVRINISAADWSKKTELGIRVGFAVPFKKPNPGGLPDPDENETLNVVEDGISEIIQASGPAIHVLSITTGAFKEFVYYVKNPQGIEQAHKDAIERFPDYDVQCYGKQDEGWDQYFEWYNA